jgi:hypothetical protein
MMGSDVLNAIKNFEISDRSFDAEATAKMGDAFDRACKDMHGNPNRIGFERVLLSGSSTSPRVASATPRKCANLR